MNRRIAWFVRAIATVTSVAGCGGVPGLDGIDAARGPRSWIFSTRQADDGLRIVAVTDKTGRIDAAELDPAGQERAIEVANPPDEPTVVLVPWLGGACDTRTSVSIEQPGEGAGVLVRIRIQSGDACRALGVPHVLRLTALAPLPAASVEVVGGGR